MLNGLVQHESQESSPVGHGCSYVTLLLEELIQLVPLSAGEDVDTHSRSHGTSPSQHQSHANVVFALKYHYSHLLMFAGWFMAYKKWGGGFLQDLKYSLFLDSVHGLLEYRQRIGGWEPLH